MHKLLIINPGSTSTKIAVFQDKECVFKTNRTSPTFECKITRIKCQTMAQVNF